MKEFVTDQVAKSAGLTKMFSTKDENLNLFPSNSGHHVSLDEGDLETAYERNPIGFRALNKRSTDPWDKGFEILNREGEVWEEGMELLRDLHYKQKGMKATFFALLHGSSAIAFGFKEKGGRNKTAEDPVNPSAVTGIDYINVITRNDLKDDKEARYEIEEEDEDDPYYGQIKFLVLEDGRKIHADRFEFLRPYSIGPDPEGTALLKPMFNALTVFDNVIYGAGQSYYYAGTGFPTLELKDVPDDEVDDVKSQFLDDIPNQPGMAYDPQQFNFEFKGAEGKALDPGKYFDPMFTILGGALGGSKQVFFGAESGEVSGSETNLEEYFGDVSSFQQFKLTPFNRRVFKRFDDVGIWDLPENFRIEWKDLFEKSEEKQAQIAKDRARAFAQYKKAGLDNEEAAKLSGIDIDVIKNPDEKGMADDSGVEAGEPDPEERDQEDQEVEQ